MEKILAILAILYILSNCISDGKYNELTTKYNNLKSDYYELEKEYDSVCGIIADCDKLEAEIEEKNDIIERYEKQLGIYDYEEETESYIYDYGDEF